MKKRFTSIFYCSVAISLFTNTWVTGSVVEGDLHPWHTITLTFEGPEASEAWPSTFRDHRLTVTFRNGLEAYVVPGFYAADGMAGRSHATAGNKWQVRFTPDMAGEWTYTAEFVMGKDVAINGEAGEAYALEGARGTFVVEPLPEPLEGPDFRARGQLEYVGKHHMQFAGTGEYFLKGGTGSPENLLAYAGFDGTWDAAQNPGFPSLGADQLHHYRPHRDDWQNGDPFWTNEKGIDGKGIIGLMNYVSAAGLNSFYLMPMTYEGDGCDVWPWVNPANREIFDISKLEQWEMVFSHMQRKGIHIHMLLTETENESLFEVADGGGEFADTRKLYYREMVARFGHHLAISWDLGEESGWDDDKGPVFGKGISHDQREAFAEYIDALDAYDHPLKIHEILTVEIYPQLLDFEHFDGPALQRHEDYNAIVQEFVEMSAESDRPWLVSMDEPLGWEFGLLTDAEDPTHDKARKEVLWGTYMAGGSGVEFYFGWQNNAPTSDLSAEDMSVRKEMWRQTKIAREFFETYLPFHDMQARNDLVAGDTNYVFAKEGELYLVYLSEGGSAKLDLGGASGTFAVSWFDPRKGGDLQAGERETVRGGGIISIGEPPDSPAQDWAVLVRKR